MIEILYLALLITTLLLSLCTLGLALKDLMTE